mmetsp:Transcript_36901/g.48497  ORF Transcript_36901/g.48497 Transcript_36901/m.48497 type:complete len:124 (-) Transcript_36901:868-1239(-)
MAKIIEQSKLRSAFEYVPYMFAWHVHFQGLIFSPYTMLHEELFKVKYHREVFQLADGEKIALDWFEEPKPDPKNPDKRPLLVCIGGLGGGHQATYMKATMARAKQAGYQVVFVLFRGTGDMPV